jgi:hypothetical protein
MNVRIALALMGAWLALALGAQAVFASAPPGIALNSMIVGTVRPQSGAIGSVPVMTGAARVAPQAQALAALPQTTPRPVGPSSGGAAEPAGRRTPFNGFPWLPLVTIAGVGAVVLRKIWLL